MKFFYADTLDHVDPGFDFQQEVYSPGRIPQRDDVYAHELMHPAQPYDGLLVSRHAFDGLAQQGRYSQAQRQRFMRQGAQRFLRFPADGRFDADEFPILADCGAFNYRNEPDPPYTVESMIEFYELCGFTHGVSVDHMIGGYDPNLDQPEQLSQTSFPGMHKRVPEEWQRRYQLTLDNAAEFIRKTQAGKYRFKTIGVAQGWSPASYRRAVHDLVGMGYRYIALGGLVPLKTPDLLAVLEEVRAETGGRIGLHLFGITRLENFDAFHRAGVHSFDSTSPMRQAFKDAKDNYYATGEHYTAVRIPQVDDGPRLLQLIRSHAVKRQDALQAEQGCLEALRGLDRGEMSVDTVIAQLQTYEDLFDGSSRWADVRRTLTDRPWQHCPCPICKAIGVEVIIFRGSNRNKRRGYHNLWWTHQLLQTCRDEAQENCA